MFNTATRISTPNTEGCTATGGFSTFSLTGRNNVLDINEAAGNTEPPRCPEQLCVPIMSPHCPERGQPKTEGTHQGSIAPVAIAHQGAKGKIKLGWVALELENIQLKGDLGACLDNRSQTHRDFS